MRTALERFGTARMLGEYRANFYLPAAQLAARVRGRRGKMAVNLARWKKLVQARWPGVRLEILAGDAPGAVVTTSGIPAESIAVEAERSDGTRKRLRLRSGNHERAEFALGDGDETGLRALRVFPEHELLPHPYELGLLIRAEISVA